jgi:hypothetical protein
MADGPQKVETIGWSAIRPFMVGMLLVVDAAAVAVLGIGQHKGWLGGFIGFAIVLVGLIWLMGWSIRHRHDDDRAS